jgi:hypothetical protein
MYQGYEALTHLVGLPVREWSEYYIPVSIMSRVYQRFHENLPQQRFSTMSEDFIRKQVFPIGGLTGKEGLQTVPAEAHDYPPVLSPTGRRICRISEAIIMQPDGREKELAKKGSPGSPSR